ncbi:MAG: hypothetical protein HFG75_10500 [Hungatella sp.]|nr:hypothetical protein [Hungatella sp.]
MTVQIGIVLGIFLLFIALILSGKTKIHVAAMMIPIALEITGVLEFKEAWGGMLNNSIVMMAGMFVVGAAVGKTSIVSRLSKTLIKGESSDFRIMLGIAVPIILLSCVINATAIMTIMIPMITGICAEQKRPLSKFMFASACLAQLWAGFIPIGGNAGGYLAQNTIVENLGGVGTFTYFTNMIVKIPAILFVTPVVIWLTVKMAPDLGNVPAMAQTGGKDKTEAGKGGRGAVLTPSQEKLTALIFTATILGIIVCACLKLNTWYASSLGALALVITGIVSDREAIRAMGNPVIFITIGTMPLSTALKSTGADVLLADTFNSMTGDMSPLMTMVCMYIVCFVLTQFVTNSAVNNAFKTLAALICVQNGYDARALMLTCQEASSNCYLTPMAAPAMTMGYEAGGYKMKDYLKMGILLCLIRFVTFLVYVPVVFPLK